MEEYRRALYAIKMRIMKLRLHRVTDDNLIKLLHEGRIQQFNERRSELKISHPDFPDANLSKADLSSAVLQEINLSYANLSNANLSGANLFTAISQMLTSQMLISQMLNSLVLISQMQISGLIYVIQ